MLSAFRRRVAALLMQTIVLLLGLLSAAVLLMGLFVAAVFALTIASLLLVYLALFHRRRGKWIG
jgi:hypothetical protein